MAPRPDLSLESLGPNQLRQIRATSAKRLEIYYQALTRGYHQGGERYVLDICRQGLLKAGAHELYEP